MRVRPFIKRLIFSPKRALIKKTVLKEISNTEQSNIDVVNVYRIDPDNVGDYYCAPHHYFENINPLSLDILDYKNTEKEITDTWIKRISENKLIVGGGGLLNRRSFERQMKLFSDLGKNNKKTVLWGPGHNSANKRNFGKLSSYNIDTSNFGLIGLRDYDIAPKNWVPCVSCLHSVFDKNYSTTQEIGIVFHKKTMNNRNITSRFQGFPTTSNTTDLEELINFIGSSETIITDSYHSMYWAFLLGKKVVVVPNSSKFFGFKYAPVYSTFENSIEDIKKAQSYTGVLSQCREINKAFAKKVFEYLEI